MCGPFTRFTFHHGRFQVHRRIFDVFVSDGTVGITTHQCFIKNGFSQNERRSGGYREVPLFLFPTPFPSSSAHFKIFISRFLDAELDYVISEANMEASDKNARLTQAIGSLVRFSS